MKFSHLFTVYSSLYAWLVAPKHLNDAALIQLVKQWSSEIHTDRNDSKGQICIYEKGAKKRDKLWQVGQELQNEPSCIFKLNGEHKVSLLWNQGFGGGIWNKWFQIKHSPRTNTGTA